MLWYAMKDGKIVKMPLGVWVIMYWGLSIQERVLFKAGGFSFTNGVFYSEMIHYPMFAQCLYVCRVRVQGGVMNV